MMRSVCTRCCPALLGLLMLARPATAGSAANPLAPFTVSNQSPLVAGFGLPAQLDAELPAAGTWQGALRYDLASHYTENSNARESILLDGESQRLTLALGRSFAGGWNFGFEVPWVSHRGGTLDSFIEDWHDTFSLPQGGRDTAPKGRLEYRYVRDGVTLLEMTEGAAGVGDVALSCGWQASLETEPARTALAFGVRLKLPTGDSDRLLGSGSTDLALWLAGRAEEESEEGAFAAWFALGGLAMTRGDILGGQQQPLAAFGRFGLGWSPARFISFKVQVDGNTSLYADSDLDELGSALVLTLGGSLILPAQLRLDLGVGEDLVVGASPDVVFHLALSRNF